MDGGERPRPDWPLLRRPVVDALRSPGFREFVQSAIPAGEWELIREALQRGQLTGKRFSDVA